MTFSGWVGILAGWYVTEIGRQPYLVTGVLTAAQAATKLPAGMIFSSLLAYLILYACLLSAYVWVIFYLARQVDNPGDSQVDSFQSHSGSIPSGVQ